MSHPGHNNSALPAGHDTSEASVSNLPPTRSDNEPYSQTHSDARPSSAFGMIRRLSREFGDSHPPESFSAATGDMASTFFADQNQHHGQSPATETGSGPEAVSEDATLAGATGVRSNDASVREHTDDFQNGYHFPPKYPWKESTKHGLASFWKFFITPWGFFWTIYGLNVVAWGGMLFLLLCNAAPAMCVPDCNDIDSPRRKWVEWDSQVLTALFCVTAFGLAPWRFRDLYYLLQYRIMGKYSGLQRLAGINRGWYRLPGSQELPIEVGPGKVTPDIPMDAVPIPEKNMPDPPLTGQRAPATSVWKLDFVIWSMVLNTFAQCGLCGIMWGINRFDRPSWSTGFLVAVGCIIAMVGGLVMFFEGKKVKGIEGVPCSERDLEKLRGDKDQGIHHYNNIKDKKPKQKTKVRDLEANPEKS
ncbi:hypothetical protein B0T22DRAFT_26382 [Podospora appendiculata]|uniref:Uncharacterized protein n=1 Tax=Podospora appendiculata TaxID=314037 RepID=A0AAE0XG57_9PEZI|nr:hypothetical protein B0T22DRAFT_26382 [Podospora appendiculata]